MTSVLPGMGEGLESYRQSLEPKLLKTAKHIGDIQKLKVLYEKLESYETYGLYDGETLACLVMGIFETFPKLGKALEIKVMVVPVSQQGNGLSTKLLHFLKTRLQYNLVIANVISFDNKANFTKLAKKDIFNVKWLNIKTGDIEPFDSEPDKKFKDYDTPSGWQLLLEQYGAVEQQLIESGRAPIFFSAVDPWAYFPNYDFDLI